MIVVTHEVYAKSARRKSLVRNPLYSRSLNKIPFRNLIFLSLIINLTALALVIVLQRNLPPQIPLFYGLPKTKEQLSGSSSLIIPSIIAIGVMLINILISQITNEEFFKKTLILTGTVSAFLSIITTVKIIFLIGSF